jgi:hypothetical protein
MLTITVAMATLRVVISITATRAFVKVLIRQSLRVLIRHSFRVVFRQSLRVVILL